MNNCYNKIEEDLEYIIKQNLPWEELEGKSILITGANGMIASYLVEVVLYLNKKIFKNKSIVYAVVRNREKAIRRFDRYKNDKNLKIIIQDVNEAFKLKEKIDFIIHAASQASPVYYGKDPVGTLLPNTVGTYNLLELAKINKVKGFLFISSSEVYGEVSKKQVPIKEDAFGYIDINNLRSCYSESKRMGETMCVSWFHQYGIPVKIARPFHTYGYGLSPQDGRVFADFIFDIVNKRDIIMKSDGKAKRSFCYLADAVAGFFTVLLKGEPGLSYNVGNDKATVKIVELADILVNLFPELRLKVVKKEISLDKKYLKSEVVNIFPDILKIKQLGWEPGYSIEEGFKRSIESYL